MPRELNALEWVSPFLLVSVWGKGLLFVFQPQCCSLPGTDAVALQVSMAAVVGFLYTTVAIVMRASIITSHRKQPFADISLFHWDVGALFAIPIIVFGFNCHANVVTIFTCGPVPLTGCYAKRRAEWGNMQGARAAP